MNSKDKEKLKMCAATMSILPSETIIIDPEDYSNDAEDLSAYIAEFLADSAANSFKEAMSNLSEEKAAAISGHISYADSESLVKILQTIFIMADMKYAARQLDLLEFCYSYDESAYYYFEDEFYNNEAVEPYFTVQFFKILSQDDEDEPEGGGDACGKSHGDM